MAGCTPATSGRWTTSGRLTILDRRDDLIISGGENISPAEVEAVLLSHPDVADAAVVGRPDATWGAVPVAAVVGRAGHVARHREPSTSFARERLAGYKVPAAIEVVSAIPRTASGKVLRRRGRDGSWRSSARTLFDRPAGRRAHPCPAAWQRARSLVLLHATLSNALELDPLAIALADAGTGAGRSTAARRAPASMPPDDVLGPVDVQVHIDDILAVLDALVARSSRVFVVGHSYGGCVGLELAARHPGARRGCVAVRAALSVGPARCRRRRLGGPG